MKDRISNQACRSRVGLLLAAAFMLGLVQPAVAASSVGFPDDAPDTYQLGSGQAITFDLDGSLGSNQDVLAIAWSHDEQRIVDAFAHTLTGEPWRIDPAYLDQLPTGGVQLQLHLRGPDGSRQIARHEIIIQSADDSGSVRTVNLSVDDSNDGETSTDDGGDTGDTQTTDTTTDTTNTTTSDTDTSTSDDTDVRVIEGSTTEDSTTSDSTLDTSSTSEVITNDTTTDDTTTEDSTTELSTADAELPTVSFTSDAPASYTVGSGEAIPFAVDGTMPEDGDVLALAWSHDEQRMVDGFAHTLTEGPWQLEPTSLNHLPEGNVQLQLHRRIPGAERTVARHEMEVTVQGRTSVPSVSFYEDTPTTYRQGSNQNIAFNVDGSMPSNGDVLALAWSEDEQRMVDAFAHELTDGPWELRADALEQLPTGSVQLQLHRRIPGTHRTVAYHMIEVRPELPTVGFASSAPSTYENGSGATIALNVDGEMPQGGRVRLSAYSQDQQSEVAAFAHELTQEPWQISAAYLDTLPAGEIELRAQRVIEGEQTTTATHTLQVTIPTPDVEVAFASDTPTAYQQGSGQHIAFDVTGEMPADGDVLVLAWSDEQQQMVDAFAHAVAQEPWRIAAQHLDTLPTGRVQLQLHRRVPGLDRTVSRHWIEIQPAEEPTTFEPPTVSFASGTPSVYQQGSGEAINFNVDGELPEGADILALAWSDGEQRMVDEFAHSFTASPWQISAARMDMLPEGGTSLQLLLRLPEHDNVQVTHWMTVEAPTTDDGSTDDGSTDDGSTDDGSTDDGTTDDGSTDDGSTDDGSTDDGSDTDDPWTDPDNGDSGWTQLSKSSDTRVIHVSSSEGDDGNDGSLESPVRTISRAYDLAGRGRPDWILLKAGDEWDEDLGGRSGRSTSEPFVISAYGSGPRPAVHGSLEVIDSNVKHFWVIGLEFAGREDYGIRWLSDGENILFEDLLVHDNRQGISVTSGSGAGPSDVRIRRCIIVDQHTGGSGHSVGLYTSDVHGLLIEDNVFDHNGWQDPSDETIFNHNVYLSRTNTDVVIRNNISARASSHGMQVRSGGLVEDNLVIQNPMNLTFGATTYSWPDDHRSGIVRRNVIIDSGSIQDMNRGVGLHLTQLRDSEVYGNIIVHRENGSGSTRSLQGGKLDRVSVHDNVMWDWGTGVEVDDSAGDLDMYNNQIEGRLFNGSKFDISGTTANVAYEDPTHSIDNYMTEQLGASSGSLEAFLNEVRARPRGVWDEQYTAKAVNAHVRSGFTVLPTFD